MCGLCGIINFNNHPVDENRIRIMLSKIRHRGPDDEGIFINNNHGFGFVRLSILDLSPMGYQPMFDLNNRYMIMHNGEVYNYIELRQELIKKGYKFKSNTDTEVILYSYIEWGEDCLNRFNGMWAFVIYDTFTKNIFISRDRFGVKPFYYYLDKDQFIFASEIQPILEVLKKKPKANDQVIFDYLVFNRTDQGEHTFFESIKKLQHGHILKNQSQKSNVEIKQWYNLRESVRNAESFDYPEDFRKIFSSAVGLRLRSDVPVGVCLSGGLDSSSIVSILLNDYCFSELNTFSAIYGSGVVGDESKFIQYFTNSIKNMHFTTPTAYTLLNDLDRFITAHGEPVPSTSPYAQFKVMELAKKNVVVTLDGQGADEVLAGYHYFFGFYFKDLMKQLRLLKLFGEARNYFSNHKSLYGLLTFFYFLLPNDLRNYLRINEKGYLNEEFIKNNQYSVIADVLYGSDSLQDALINHFEYKLEHLLKWEDRNSMHFSIEARVPFLDYRLVERTLASSSELIIKNGNTKHILREAMRGILPEIIRTRKDKIGFETPETEWFREPILRDFIVDILQSDSFYERKIVNAQKAKTLYFEHYDRKKNISKEIWKWINLELWFREYID